MFRRLLLTLALTVATLALATTAALATRSQAPSVHVAKNAKYGKILVTPKGFTLYTYKPDTPNHSTCTGSCASLWPPFVLPKGTKTVVKPAGVSGTFGSIPRGNGRQVTYDKHPLYTYKPDKKPGEAMGQGIGGVWFVVRVK